MLVGWLLIVVKCQCRFCKSFTEFRYDRTIFMCAPIKLLCECAPSSRMEDYIFQAASNTVFFGGAQKINEICATARNCKIKELLLPQSYFKQLNKTDSLHFSSLPLLFPICCFFYCTITSNRSNVYACFNVHHRVPAKHEPIILCIHALMVYTFAIK